MEKELIVFEAELVDENGNKIELEQSSCCGGGQSVGFCQVSDEKEEKSNSCGCGNN